MNLSSSRTSERTEVEDEELWRRRWRLGPRLIHRPEAGGPPPGDSLLQMLCRQLSSSCLVYSMLV